MQFYLYNVLPQLFAMIFTNCLRVRTVIMLLKILKPRLKMSAMGATPPANTPTPSTEYQEAHPDGLRI